MRYEHRTNSNRNHGMRGQGKGRFGSNNHSHMNQSRYRYNKKQDQYHATHDQNYHNHRYSCYSNFQNPGNHASYYDRNSDRYPSIPGPAQLPSSYASLAEIAEERESSKASSSSNYLKHQAIDTNLAKLSILPTCDTMDTLLGSSEDISESVSSTSSFHEHTINAQDSSHNETLDAIFPNHHAIKDSANLQESTTYYRDLLIEMNSGSLFAMSPRSFLIGKKNSMTSNRE